jgi:hypothetical protein
MKRDIQTFSGYRVFKIKLVMCGLGLEAKSRLKLALSSKAKPSL